MRTDSTTVKRKKRRRRHRGAAFYAVPIVLLMTIALVVLSYKLLKVETIQVEGTTRYQTGEILAASGLDVGNTMLKIKPSAVIKSIEQKLSYIGEVQLQFQLPSTVILTVSEATVACSVQNGSGYILLSEKMKVLQPDSPLADANAPIIKGLKSKQANQGEIFLPENSEDITVLQALFGAFTEYVFPTVNEIDLTDISNITLACKNNCNVLLGGPTQLAYKVAFVKEVLNESADIEEAGGLIINAQALDSEVHPNVSVLPARSVYSEPSSSQPESPGDDSTAVGDSQHQGSGGETAETTAKTDEQTGSKAASANSAAEE